jgi:aminoglycoside phosphotransferase (APT) family kinase protein
MKPFWEDLSTFALSLAEGGRKLFSPPLHWVCLANGDADFHDNVIFFGFESKQSDPVLVSKVPRLVENGWMLKTEYDHLVELWNCIGSEAAKYVPKPYGFTTIQERPVLLISYVPGESLTRLWRNSFWGDVAQVMALAREAGHSLRELNRLTETPVQPADSLRVDLQKRVDTFRELFQVSTDEDRELAALINIFEERSSVARHKVLIQGDFWHGNMIRDRQRGTLMLVDWQFARWSVDVSMDVYFFLLASAFSATELGSPEERATRAFRLLSDWRANVIPEYLAAYGQPEHYVLLPQKYGMMLCCVEKSTRSALEFGYSHPDDLMWRHLFTKLHHWPMEH